MKSTFTKPALRSSLFGVLLALAPVLFAQETQRQYLSGHDKDDAVPWKFMVTSGAQSGVWTNLPVPSHWDMHGFGTLNYGRDLTNAYAEQGRYERAFKVPAAWSGRRVFLVFDGSMTDTEAKVNGQSAGSMHQGSFYRFKYDITSLVKPGADNLLEVAVNKHSADEGVNRAERQSDYWVFGGIFRPVWLEAVPQQHIERVAIDAKADGKFAVDVFVNSPSSSSSSSSSNDTLEAQVTDLNGHPVGPAFTGRLAAAKTTLQAQFPSPRQWTAETPNLYRVEVRLKRGNQILHRTQQRFGFRTFEVRENDGLYLNGQRVVLKGVCRHSFWPDSGRCLSEAVHRMDIEAMKDMNMNAVRMSHYPPDEQFLDLCDELGLYVLDELAGWQKFYGAEVGRKLVEEMIVRDVNHPSILFWDNGNEGGWNIQLDADYAKWDPQRRPVLHPWDTFNGVNTTHYLTYERTVQAAEGRPMVRNNNHGTDPATNTTSAIPMSTEFLHGLFDGGIGAGFEDYWNVLSKSKYNGGGFFWVLADEGVKRPGTGRMDVAGNAAPDGIVGPYREREGSYYTVKELWSPIVISERALPEDFSGALTVENHFSFTDASRCGFSWQLLRFRSPADAKGGFSVLSKKKADAPSIAPGGKGVLKLNLPANWKRADALALSVTDPSGRELWNWVWPVPNVDSFRNLTSVRARRSAAVTETAAAIEVKAAELTVRISKQTGLLAGAQRGAQSFSLTNGPHLATGEATLASVVSRQDGSDVVINATYTGDLKSVIWRVRGNGWVQCDYTYSANGPKEYHGVIFDYPESLVKKKRWLGDGPYRVWKNRVRGVTLGVWENDYNNTITGWSGWKYPEFKGCFANVRWMQLETAEGPITAVLGRDDLFVQVLKPELPPQNLLMRSAVTLPEAGLAFLHGIPPIGNKFSSAAQTGPQGAPNQTSGDYSGSVSFYFGKLP